MKKNKPHRTETEFYMFLFLPFTSSQCNDDQNKLKGKYEHTLHDSYMCKAAQQ